MTLRRRLWVTCRHPVRNLQVLVGAMSMRWDEIKLLHPSWDYTCVSAAVLMLNVSRQPELPTNICSHTNLKHQRSDEVFQFRNHSRTKCYKPSQATNTYQVITGCQAACLSASDGSVSNEIESRNTKQSREAIDQRIDQSYLATKQQSCQYPEKVATFMSKAETSNNAETV